MKIRDLLPQSSPVHIKFDLPDDFKLNYSSVQSRIDTFGSIKLNSDPDKGG